MLTSEEVREIELRVAAGYISDKPGFRDWLKMRRDVAALFSDRAEMQAEIERLAKPDTHTCLTCEHWGTSMSEYPCLECGQHYDRSDLWEPALEADHD